MTVATGRDIPQTDPRAGYFEHRDEIDSAIRRVMESGWYINGDEVRAFEREFAAYIGVGHATGVGSGTDALELSLRAAGIGAGDLVFTVSHTAVATVAAIESAGATPVLLDIDPATYTLDVSKLEAALANPPDGKPRAVIPVHLYGHPAELKGVLDVARRHGLRVIEDCAQSHGATLDGRITGSWGDIAAFSFYPTKNLGTFGDGGMIVTSDPELADRVRLLQQYGWKDRYVSEIAGRNSRLDELHAAILRVKLGYLDAGNARRRAIAAHYDEMLADAGLVVPAVASGAGHAYHQYAVCLERRDELRDFLRKEAIGSLVHYPVPVHLQPAYRGRLHGIAPLPETERVARQVLSLPMYPQLSDQQVERVGESITRFFGERAT